MFKFCLTSPALFGINSRSPWSVSQWWSTSDPFSHLFFFLSEWCAQTDSTPNPHGAWVHFDLSQTTIPNNWFPQPFGYDIGQWIATYSEVSCTKWAGYQQPQTSGLAVAGAGCCPANPTYDNQTCPMSGSSGTTASSKSSHLHFDCALGTLIIIALLSVIYLYW